MELKVLSEKHVIYDILKHDSDNQIFALGDLDDFYWPHTQWYSLEISGETRALALIYTGSVIPTLLLFNSGHLDKGRDLLQIMTDLLPDEFYAHLSPELLRHFAPETIVDNYGLSLKMVVRRTFGKHRDEKIRVLHEADVPAIRKLLQVAYPQNWFDERMIRTGKYIGYIENNQLIGVAGIHVCSPEYKVAALGNIATHPEFRGKRIATKLVEQLCADLQETTEVIGLNVRADNQPAIDCYCKLGFEITGEYVECRIRLK